jgi:prepilin-type N-terminal cleavage/methylation domain-containing protein
MKTAYKHDRGFTLIEMLIVIGIMMIMIAAAATMMQPASESRRIREAGRMINVYLSAARNRAIELRRPYGVTFRNFPPSASPGVAMNADQCESPPCYTGDTDAAAVRVTNGGHDTLSGKGVLFATFSEGISTGLIRPYDLIQVNSQGPYYCFSNTNPVDKDGYITASGGTTTLTLTFDDSQGQQLPWPTAGLSGPLPFRVFRAPIKTAAAALQFPTGSVVDFRWSGVGGNYFNVLPEWDAGTEYQVGQSVTYQGRMYVCIRTGSGTDSNRGKTPSGNPAYWQETTGDLTIVFSPNGSIDGVYHCGSPLTANEPIYLLVGKAGRPQNTFVANNSNETTLTNFQDLNNVWVTINPKTGAVATEPMAACTSPVEATAVTQSRSLAAQGQGMGGK